MRNRTAIVAAAIGGSCILAGLGWATIQYRHARQQEGEGKAPSIREPEQRPEDLPTEGKTPPTRKPEQASEDLTAEDEASLRAIVAMHFIATQYWARGGADPNDPTKRFRVLVLPQGVGGLFGQKPIGTLRVLKRIIESAPTADAHAAIAYAHAAVGYANDDPVPLIHARSYAHDFTLMEFEDVDPFIQKTNRQIAVDEIEKLIARVQDAQKRKQDIPNKQ